MKSQCPISGIEFPTPEFSFIKQNQLPHPIFNLPVRNLLSMSGKWASGAMNETESKLFFLALLKSTAWIQFNAPAQPENAVVQKNMELAILFANWSNNIAHGSMILTSFPKYNIGYNNQSMSNIRAYFDIWLDKINGLERDYRYKYDMRTTPEQRAKDEALRRLIRSGLKTPNNMPLKLAEWALNVCGYHPVEDELLYSYWTRLFQLKEPEIYSERLRKAGSFKIVEGYGMKPLSPLSQDIIELVETMEQKLESYSAHGSTLSREVLIHLRKVRDINLAGPSAFYGIEDIELTHRSPMISRLKDAYINGPKEKPEERKYPNKIAYLSAKAKWTMGQEYKRLISEQSTQLKQEFQSASLDASMNAEDAEYDGIDTVIQFEFGLDKSSNAGEE